MKIDYWDELMHYMQGPFGTPFSQLPVYLAIQDAVDQGSPQISEERQRGTILQLAAYFSAKELYNPYNFWTQESDEFEAGREDATRIHKALVRGDMAFPEPREIEMSLEDIRNKYDELKTCRESRREFPCKEQVMSAIKAAINAIQEEERLRS